MERLDARFAPKNALILGLRLTLSLDDALGIPSAITHTALASIMANSGGALRPRP